MTKKPSSEPAIEEVRIIGHSQSIVLRTYTPPLSVSKKLLPTVMYFHGGRFSRGSLDDADATALFISRSTPAWVVSVGYSLAPEHPFPAAIEDGYHALEWAYENAEAHGADRMRIGVAGHDAGGNLATTVSAMARDRGMVEISAQVLLAPLLDPSLTRLAFNETLDTALRVYASCYRDYLPKAMQRLHPYAAPLESQRLSGLPPALIVTSDVDQLHIEAEKYASLLIAAGVPTEFTRQPNISHEAIASFLPVLNDITAFFQKRLI